MGSSKTSESTTRVIHPTPPPQPSTKDAIEAYVAALPQLFQAQLDFAPQEAAQQLQLAEQYALPLAEVARDAQAALFPETTALQEQLATEAARGIEEGPSQQVRDQFLDDFRANLGTNVGSPIGAQATATGLAKLDEDFRRYYRDLALSVAGRQPLAQPTAPQFTNQLGGFSPGQALNFQAQNYGTFAAAGRPITATNSYSRRTLGQQFGDYAGGLNSLFGGGDDAAMAFF